MSSPRNLVVAQSGGPTHVINSSLQGILETARDLDAIGTVYGARHGIEGVLKEELLDLSAQSAEEVSLLRFTPAAGSIGTCRYKLRAGQDEDFDRVIVDVHMPGKTGPEFFESLTDVAPGMRSRTLFMTGGFVEGDTERFIQDSGRPAIKKPFDLAELAHTVEGGT